MVNLTVGNRIDTRRGEPIPVTGRVKLISDGKFLYRGKCQHAGTWASMGLCVVLEIGNIWCLISSIATYEYDDAQYRSLGVNVDEFKILGLKNPISYKQSLAGIYSKSYILDTQGPCSPNLLQYPYTRLPHPLYPFEDLENPEIEVLVKD